MQIEFAGTAVKSYEAQHGHVYREGNQLYIIGPSGATNLESGHLTTHAECGSLEFFRVTDVKLVVG